MQMFAVLSMQSAWCQVVPAPQHCLHLHTHAARSMPPSFPAIPPCTPSQTFSHPSHTTQHHLTLFPLTPSLTSLDTFLLPPGCANLPPGAPGPQSPCGTRSTRCLTGWRTCCPRHAAAPCRAATCTGVQALRRRSTRSSMRMRLCMSRACRSPRSRCVVHGVA